MHRFLVLSREAAASLAEQIQEWLQLDNEQELSIPLEPDSNVWFENDEKFESHDLLQEDE